MNRQLTTWAMIVMTAAIAGSGCGGDDSGKAGGDKGGSGRAAGSGGTAGAASMGITCGTMTCTLPEASDGLTACCLDPFNSKCGTQRPGGMCATPQATGDPRCPAVSVMGAVMLPSCCTADDKCGIEASQFGSMGCVDLATAAEMAKTMGGANISWPEPRACTASGN